MLIFLLTIGSSGPNKIVDLPKDYLRFKMNLVLNTFKVCLSKRLYSKNNQILENESLVFKLEGVSTSLGIKDDNSQEIKLGMSKIALDSISESAGKD